VDELVDPGHGLFNGRQDVEVFSLVEKLEVDEVARAFASLTRDGVEFLCDLMVSAHYPNWLWCFEPDLGEESGQVCRESVLRLVDVGDCRTSGSTTSGTSTRQVSSQQAATS